jgi:hypothetical protein
MILHTLFTIAVILLTMLVYIGVQRRYRRFGKQHPELGPFRQEGEGCGSCSGGRCGGSDRATCPDR